MARSDHKAEADVSPDDQQARSRAPQGDYVGRIAEDDPGAEGETGAERRARHGQSGRDPGDPRHPAD